MGIRLQVWVVAVLMGVAGGALGQAFEGDMGPGWDPSTPIVFTHPEASRVVFQFWDNGANDIGGRFEDAEAPFEYPGQLIVDEGSGPGIYNLQALPFDAAGERLPTVARNIEWRADPGATGDTGDPADDANASPETDSGGQDGGQHVVRVAFDDQTTIEVTTPGEPGSPSLKSDVWAVYGLLRHAAATQPAGSVSADLTGVYQRLDGLEAGVEQRLAAIEAQVTAIASSAQEQRPPPSGGEFVFRIVLETPEGAAVEQGESGGVGGAP